MTKAIHDDPGAPSPISDPTTGLDRVELPGGAVSLATIDEVKARAAGLRQQGDTLGAREAEPASRAEAAFADAGAILVRRRADWPSAALVTEVNQAESLIQRIEAEDAHQKAIDQRSHTGVFGWVGQAQDSIDRSRTQSGRNSDALELRALLVRIAQAAPPTSIAEVEALRRRVAAASQEVAALQSQVTSVAAASAALEDETNRRENAIRHMGFDSLYQAAWLAVQGPQPVQSPLILKRGEEAYVSMTATLARYRTRTQFVGRSQGFSFPIGHTGIRYRVGSFRGEPVQRTYLSQLDTGTLVLTNQRVAFVGAQKSTTMPLGKLLHVEAYTDGLAIFREGRESPDFFLLRPPQYFLLYLNAVLAIQGIGASG